MSATYKLVAVFTLCVATAARAQVLKCGPNEVVPWWPRAVANDGANTLSAADRATIEARLAAIETLMRKTAYATPRGMAVQPWFSYHEITDRTTLYQYGFVLATYARCSKYDEGGAHLLLDINPDPMGWSESDRPMPDEHGDGLYTERVRTPALFGATATFGHFQERNSEGIYLLFTTGGQSPTLPVTREEYLRAVIFSLEGKNGEKVKAAAAIVSKTPYERWMEEAAERRNRNEELYAIVAKTNPSQAAKMRADMEKAELAETEKLKKADAYERAQLGKNVAGLTVLGDKYRAQLAAMTPAERTSPAFAEGFDLVPAGTPNANAIVRKNPAFYRATSSPLQPRAILVRLPNAREEDLSQQAELFKQLDWAAIRKMVN
jgi:hypothetical protein